MPSKKKVVRVRARKSGSKIQQQILTAISASNERNGMSLPTLKKVLAATGLDPKKNQARIRMAIKTLVKRGRLVQTKGMGATASYRINDRRAVPAATSRRARPRRGRKRRGKKRRAAKKSSRKGRRRRRVKKSKRSRKGRRRPKKGGRKRRARRAPRKKPARRRRRRAASKRR